MLNKKGIFITILLIFGVVCFFTKKNNRPLPNKSECLDNYQNCDTIYKLDASYSDLESNLLYARWLERKGENQEAIEILDSLLILSSKDKKSKFYQDCILYKFLAKQSLGKLKIEEVEEQLRVNKNKITEINLLSIKAILLRYQQETNYSYSTALFNEFHKSQLTTKQQSNIHYSPWFVHAINLIREESDTLISNFYLRKSIEHCKKESPTYRWMKTLLLAASEDLSEEKIEKIKTKVFNENQYSPLEDKIISTHLNWVASDNNLAIKNLLSDIDNNKSLSEFSNFYNINYLIDAYLETGNLKEAEYWTNKLSKAQINTLSKSSLLLMRKQKLLHLQFLQSPNSKKLQTLFDVSTELTNSFIRQGNSIVNDHYATTIYRANNILLESVYELNLRNKISSNDLLNNLNNIKNLYNKVSDSRSVLGNKNPSDTDLKKINYLKHEIEKRELEVNRYQDTTYQDLSIFEELYFLHQELYDLKQQLPEIENFASKSMDSQLELKSIDDETQIFDFIQTDSSIYLSRITSDNIEIEKLDFTRTMQAINEKKSQLLNRNALIESNFLDSVFVDLISPVHYKIVFIPDGELFEFPIESIKNHKGEYLLNGFSISYASQISEAINIKSSTIENEIFTASYTSDETFKDREIKNYPELPFGQYEIDKIEELYPTITSFSGNEFKEESFINGLDKDVVHISSHSSSSTDNPLDNYILVRNKEGKGVPIYGFTLKSMDWDSKLVVLSSCESGTGTIKPGCGIFSLSRDFLQSGAETVIKSLWKVNDKSTSELMIAFHENLSDGLYAAQALRHAKLKVQMQEEYSHPYYWAGFVLEGNPNVYLNTQ